MSERAHSYLSHKCAVHETGDRGGHTVVAQADIHKGELIVVWSGKLVDGDELISLPATVRRYSLQVEENHYLVSLTDREPPDYVNHSCDPNAGLSGQIALVAMRDIQAGEEISYDYAMSDGSSYDEFDCGCGAADCRGRVSGDDWKRAELWQRYAGYFSPYLQRRIAIERRHQLAKSAERVSRRRMVAHQIIPAE
ncbi:MAG: SET domain-containing protein-lysine N-methyltransferase [Hyphomicrobium sp.]